MHTTAQSHPYLHPTHPLVAPIQQSFTDSTSHHHMHSCHTYIFYKKITLRTILRGRCTHLLMFHKKSCPLFQESYQSIPLQEGRRLRWRVVICTCTGEGRRKGNGRERREGRNSMRLNKTEEKGVCLLIGDKPFPHTHESSLQSKAFFIC